MWFSDYSAQISDVFNTLVGTGGLGWYLIFGAGFSVVGSVLLLVIRAMRGVR